MFGVFTFGQAYFGQASGVSVAAVTGTGDVAFSVADLAAHGAVSVAASIGGRHHWWHTLQPVSAQRAIHGVGRITVSSARVRAIGSVTPLAITGTAGISTDGPIVSSHGAQTIAGTGEITAAVSVDGTGTQTFVSTVRVSLPSPSMTARGSVDETAEMLWRPLAIAPDAIDVAWASLQQQRDDEDVLILLGVFDA